MMRTMLVVIMFQIVAGVVWAESDGPGIPWDQLNQDEQRILQRFNQNWDQLPAERQARLRNGARRWSNMNPDERDQARQRFRQWQQMQPDEQQRLRQRFERFRRMPPERREAIREARQWFRSLPLERRQELREQWRNMSPAERRDFRRQLRKEYGGELGDRPERSNGPNGERLPHARPSRPGR